MAWLPIIASISSYLLLPLVLVFKALLLVLAPAIHLGSYIAAVTVLPLQLIAKFETLYIYLGVAAIIGLITGSILYLSSSFLVLVFDLKSVQEERRRPQTSVRTVREHTQFEGVWKNSLSKTGPDRWRNDASVQDLDRGNMRDDKGLLGQTIIEEDDDSDEY